MTTNSDQRGGRPRDATAARVLVVEDDPTIAEVVGRYLQRDGHQVEIVGDAFQGRRARTPRPDAGAGLGLTIAKRLVETHDGEIDVVNARPGCRFVVGVPAVS